MNEDLRVLAKERLANTLDGTHFKQFGEVYQGKVRDCYVRNGHRAIVVSDRISAFDRVLGTIPFKGQVLNQIAEYWFKETLEIAPNHMVSAPDPQVMIAVECEPLPVEFVMRSFLTGVTSTSIWQSYLRGDREFCGHRLPEGMRKNQRLERPLLTPSTKAEKGGHDVSVSKQHLLEMGAVSETDFDEAAAMAARLFAYGQKRALERGLILVDTKYEIGRTKEGKLVFIDEIHTPDSSRYWYADSYEMRFAAGEEPRSLDKEFLRRWMAETHGYTGDGEPPALTDDIRVEAACRYVETYERMTGESFKPALGDPNARIEKTLGGVL